MPPRTRAGARRRVLPTRSARTPTRGQGTLRAVKLGLALPQYDYSVSGESPLRWSTVVEYATLAERVGYDSLWLSDHLFLDLAKYGGSDRREGAFDPLVALSALARVVSRPRLGTLVLCLGAAAIFRNVSEAA